LNNRLHVKLLTLIVSAACAGMSASFALAAEEVQKSAQKMEEMVVTATKTAKDTSEAPATVSVVTSKDIDKMNVQSVDEALTYLPGVYTNRPGGHEPSVMGTNVLLPVITDY